MSIQYLYPNGDTWFEVVSQSGISDHNLIEYGGATTNILDGTSGFNSGLYEYIDEGSPGNGTDYITFKDDAFNFPYITNGLSRISWSGTLSLVPEYAEIKLRYSLNNQVYHNIKHLGLISFVRKSNNAYIDKYFTEETITGTNGSYSTVDTNRTITNISSDLITNDYKFSITFNEPNDIFTLTDFNIDYIQLMVSGESLFSHNDDVSLFVQTPESITNLPTGLLLFESGGGVNADSLLLSMIGGVTTGDMNLTIAGTTFNSSGLVDLYINGSSGGGESSTLDLYTFGSYNDNSNMNLYVHGLGLEQHSGEVDLFLAENHISGEMNLFLKGIDWNFIDREGLDLHVSGATDPQTFNDVELFMSGSASDWYMNLSVGGSDSFNDSLMVSVLGGVSNNVDLSVYGLGPINNSANLSVISYLNDSGEFPTYVYGGMSSDMPLYINAVPAGTSNSDVDIFMLGTDEDGIFGTLDLFVEGNNSPSGVMNLTIPGEATYTSTKYMNLFTQAPGNLDGSITTAGYLDFALRNDWSSSNSGLSLFLPTASGTEGAVPVNGSMNMYIGRDSESLSHNLPMALYGPSGENNLVNLFLEGLPNYRDSLEFSISGIEQKTDNIRLYLNGF